MAEEQQFNAEDRIAEMVKAIRYKGGFVADALVS